MYVRKVVPTLTRSAEIYLSIAGAKQLVTLGFILVPAEGRTYTCKRGGFCRKPAEQTRTASPLGKPAGARIGKRCMRSDKRGLAAL
jgi:hypothetical protein